MTTRRDPSDRAGDMGKRAARDLSRRRRAQAAGDRSIWEGLSLFGIIGWSVTVPTLIGIAVGIWLDARRTGSIVWTITCMLAGVMLGCLNAWYWVTREGRRR